MFVYFYSPSLGYNSVLTKRLEKTIHMFNCNCTSVQLTKWSETITITLNFTLRRILVEKKNSFFSSTLQLKIEENEDKTHKARNILMFTFKD